MWGLQDFALSHRLARPSMDDVDEGNLILFPEATRYVHLNALEEANHGLIDVCFSKVVHF